MFTRFRFFRLRATQFVQSRGIFNTKDPWSRENIPFFGALVGVSALSFQVAVLYPWHHELSNQFADIEKLILQLQLLSKDLDAKLTRVMVLEEEVKIKERKILDREEEILATEVKVLQAVNKLVKVNDQQIINGVTQAPESG